MAGGPWFDRITGRIVVTGGLIFGVLVGVGICVHDLDTSAGASLTAWDVVIGLLLASAAAMVTIVLVSLALHFVHGMAVLTRETYLELRYGRAASRSEPSAMDKMPGDAWRPGGPARTVAKQRRRATQS